MKRGVIATDPEAVRNKGRKRVHLATTVAPETLEAIDAFRARHPELWAVGRALDRLIEIATAAENS